jgi:phage recombination protein Bet
MSITSNLTSRTEPKNAMNELITQPKPSALGAMATRFNVEPSKLLETLKHTAFKGATDAQMMALCVVANEYGLNPFCKEIYAFPDKSGGIVPVIGVDGWYRMVNDHPQFDGVEFVDVDDAAGKIVSTTATIYRKDRSRPCSITEHVSECARNTDPWKTQPRRMLRHRAFIQCARIAFGMSGSDPEDAARMEERQVSGRVVPVTTSIFSAPALPHGPLGEPTTGPNGGPLETKAQPVAESFTLEAEPEYPATGTPEEQLEWLLEHHAMSETELFTILHRAKLVPKACDALALCGEKTISNIVSKFGLIVSEREGGAS